jgi:hypothetical protein
MLERIASMKLFGTYSRTDESFIRFPESSYAFLDRCARSEYEQVRRLLEAWFQDYPSDPEKKHYAKDPQANLCSSFQAPVNRQHQGAFFELYCFALLRSHRFEIEIEREIPKSRKRPDFLVHLNGVPICYFEATCVAESDQDAGNEVKFRQISEMLMALPSPDFDIGFLVEKEAPANSPPVARMRSDLERWLQSRSPDELHRYLAYDGWDILFSLSPRQRTRQQKGGYPSRTTGWWGDSRGSIPTSLRDKARKYGKELEHPYVIALDVVALKAMMASVEQLLLGTSFGERGRHAQATTEPESPLGRPRTTAEEGLWFGRSGGRNQHVSAALLVKELLPWAIAHKTPVLWHNPWAAKPLNPALWQGPQKIFDLQNGCWQDRAGKEGWELFQLNPDWPSSDHTSLSTPLEQSEHDLST